jgi:hypothetical protein
MKNHIKYHTLYKDDLEKIKEDFYGDMELWEKLDKWLEAKEQKKKERARIEQEITDLYDDIYIDFTKAPYEDKISTPTEHGERCFRYKFENGDTVKIVSDKLIYTDNDHITTYTLGLAYRNKFVTLANHIINNSRPRKKSSGYTNKKSSEPTSSDPNRNRYNLIKDKIKLREEQLAKLRKNDPDYDSLKNELDNYKLMANKLKNKYKFEHLSNFIDFKLINE